MADDNAVVAESIDRVFDRIDQVQRRHPAFAFPVAVFKRYGEDNGGWTGALISYYGFFSLFPFLVVLVTIATWVLGDRPDVLHRVLEAIWSKVPFAAATLQVNVEEQVQRFGTNGWLTIISVLVMVWGGLGAARVLQDAVNTVWGVARFRRPGFFPKAARSLAVMALLGVQVVATGVIAALTVTVELPIAGLVLAAILNVVLVAATTIAVYRVSIAEPVENADLLPGALTIGVGSYGLTLVAGVYVKYVVAEMTSIYGPFATTIGLLAYVSLTAQLFVWATEANVVRTRRLWPRSLTGRTLDEPDARAIELTLQRERLLSQKQLTERGSPAPRP
jgi:uncharacterized BrkB/YihY/UPF0761 family membrane protein